MTANNIPSADDTGAERAPKTPRRLRNPSPSDATGERILDAGLALIDEGLSIYEVRLADACERATRDDPSQPITTGAAYPRFPKGQNEFRFYLLGELLRRDHARHRRAGIDRASDALHDLTKTHNPVPPASLRHYIEHHAHVQITSIGEDAAFPLRLYATQLLADRDDFPRRDELLTELRAVDSESDTRWTKNFEVLLHEYGWSPRQEFEENDFELLLSALATGLALKRSIATPDEADRIDHLYASFIAAAAIGFFTKENETASAWNTLMDRIEPSRASVQTEPDQHTFSREPD